MVSIARVVILLSAILASAILAAGCGGGQSQGSSGEGPASSNPASAQPEKTTAQPKEARAGNGSKESQKTAAPSDKDAEAQAGDAVAGDGEARAGDVVAGDGGGGEAEARASNTSRTGKVRLRISGTQDAEFSGTCAVSGKEEDISGQAPERFVYRLDGEELKCNIRLRGPGELEIALIGGGTRAVQAINSGQGAVDLTYSSSGVSVTSR